jgi:hypothetical protein
MHSRVSKHKPGEIEQQIAAIPDAWQTEFEQVLQRLLAYCSERHDDEVKSRTPPQRRKREQEEQTGDQKQRCMPNLVRQRCRENAIKDPCVGGPYIAELVKGEQHQTRGEQHGQ